jgi:hypothetical protein
MFDVSTYPEPVFIEHLLLSCDMYIYIYLYLYIHYTVLLGWLRYTILYAG